MLRKINQEILKLSIPNIISNISVPLLSTVDTVLMGGLSNAHLAAVGIGSMIFNIIYWNFGFLRMGTTGITAQEYGANNNENIWLSFMRAGILALLLALFLIIFQSIIYSGCSWALNISNDVDPLVMDYYNIRIWAAPASLMLMVVMGWLFGMQNAIYPLILTIVINLVNIFLSYYLVKYEAMEVKGVAIGTTIAQYFGLTIGLIMIIVRYRYLIQMKLIRKLNKWLAFARFMKVNLDLFLRTVGLTFGFGFFYSQSSKLGDTVLAVNVVLMQFVNWMSYGIDGFAYASESLVGKYKGASDRDSMKLVIRQSFIWGGVVSLIYAVSYFVFGSELFRIFSTDNDLLDASGDLLIYMAIFPVVSFASYIWDGVFVGLTATVSMRNAMILALLIFIGSFYLLPVDPGGVHIWQAMCVFMIMRAVFQQTYYLRDGLDMK